MAESFISASILEGGGNIDDGIDVVPTMRTIMATLWLAAVVAGCAERSGSAGDRPPRVTFVELTRQPGAYHGRAVEVTAGYYASFEVSVLTSSFAESYPPQPAEPTIWVAAAPPRECLQRAEGVTWAEVIRATGTFRYDPAGGFGHLGAYGMTLQAASLACG